MKFPVELKVLTGRNSEFSDLMKDIAGLRIKVFREFPYLYDGSLDYEKRYLATYLNCEQSVVVLALHEGQVVGASTGIPLAAETDEIQRPFLTQGYHPSKIFYCGESVLLKAFRGQGIYRHFFQGRETHARAMGRFSEIFFCAVVRPLNHPRCPSGYKPLDEVWKHFGYVRYPSLMTTLNWKDLDEPEESSKPMVFWGKSL